MKLIPFIHLLAVMIAFGTVTVGDYLMINAWRKVTLRDVTLKVMPYLTRVITVALIVLYLTGIWLIKDRLYYFQFPRFQLKIFLVLLLTVNGLWLNFDVLPAIKEVWSKDQRTALPRSLLIKAIVVGGVSSTCWWGIIILMLWR